MAATTIPYLKTLFESGDTPSAEDFSTLIDTLDNANIAPLLASTIDELRLEMASPDGVVTLNAGYF